MRVQPATSGGRRTRGVACVLLVLPALACRNDKGGHGSTATDAGADAQPADGPGPTDVADAQGEPFAPSDGSRLKARWMEGPDGTRTFWGWYDTSLRAPCRFGWAADGQIRCLPEGPVLTTDPYRVRRRSLHHARLRAPVSIVRAARGSRCAVGLHHGPVPRAAAHLPGGRTHRRQPHLPAHRRTVSGRGTADDIGRIPGGRGAATDHVREGRAGGRAHVGHVCLRAAGAAGGRGRRQGPLGLAAGVRERRLLGRATGRRSLALCAPAGANQRRLVRRGHLHPTGRQLRPVLRFPGSHPPDVLPGMCAPRTRVLDLEQPYRLPIPVGRWRAAGAAWACSASRAMRSAHRCPTIASRSWTSSASPPRSACSGTSRWPPTERRSPGAGSTASETSRAPRCCSRASACACRPRNRSPIGTRTRAARPRCGVRRAPAVPIGSWSATTTASARSGASCSPWARATTVLPSA